MNSTIWSQTRVWCRTHPGKRAAIVTPGGTYVIVFNVKKEEKTTTDSGWIVKEFMSKDEI